MARTGGIHRKIFESQLGKPVRAATWRSILNHMKVANMPINADNLCFVAKCKSVATRHPVKGEALEKVIKAVGELGDKAYGLQIKNCSFNLSPKLTKDKFYRAFRDAGFKFKQELSYEIADLSEVLYKIFVER